MSAWFWQWFWSYSNSSYCFRWAVMISIEQWRARIGLFNCKRVRTATPSPVILSPMFSFLILISSQEPSQGHSSSTPPTTTNEQPSSTSDSPAHISVSKQTHEAVCTCSLTSQAAAASTSSSLHRSVFKSVLMILIIAVISQLLVISGDVETNPGPEHIGEQPPPVHVHVIVRLLVATLHIGITWKQDGSYTQSQWNYLCWVKISFTHQ